MRIAVDAMGGDQALDATVVGSVAACQRGLEVLIVGDRKKIVGRLPAVPLNLTIVDAPELIEGNDHPVQAVRGKKRSSLVVAVELVKRGEADAAVSAGNTGALMVAAKLKLGTITGIDRPALGVMLPTTDGNGCFLLDLGAGSDPRPEHLAQYAVMGDAFVRLGRRVRHPRIALLNVGTEAAKGSELYRRAHTFLSRSQLNFIGNIEGRDIMSGLADVIVCDGFVGNIVLKFAEGMAQSLFGLLRRELDTGLARRLGGLLARPAFRAVRDALDYRVYGGAPLLGVAGVVVKCHGSSDAAAIENGILLARDLAAAGLVDEVAAQLTQLTREE